MDAATQTTCRLTIPMRTSHGPLIEDHATLWFRRTGFMVELIDLDAHDLDPEDDRRVVFPLRRCDALGLGLTPEDFAEGAVLCHDGERPAGWACTPVLLVSAAEDGPAVALFDATDAARWLAGE